VLDELDHWVGGVVRGEFRRLERRVERPPAPEELRFVAWSEEADDGPADAATWALPELEEITVISDDGWSARGSFARGEVEATLADPCGWDELTGSSWFDG
jgi:hypothetical protein